MDDAPSDEYGSLPVISHRGYNCVHLPKGFKMFKGMTRTR